MVWVIGGLFSGAGALTLAELGAMLPRAGGPLRVPPRGLRSAAGVSVWLGRVSGGALRVDGDTGRGLRPVLRAAGAAAGDDSHRGLAGGAATLAIAVVTAVNVLGTRRGGTLQVFGTILKVGGVMVLIALPFLLGRGTIANLSRSGPARSAARSSRA